MTEGRLSFLDALAHLVSRRPEPQESPEPEADAPETGDPFEALQQRFESALRQLDEKVNAHVEQSTQAGAPGPSKKQSAEDRAAERLRRMEAARSAMREDIEKMHARLGTGVDAARLDALVADLEELDAQASAGRDAREIFPRARHAIVDRLRREAGELAAARIEALVADAGLEWPDPTHYRPSATPEEIERSRRRRRAEVREYFLAQSIGRTAERALGVVETWGSDYPEHGSPMWEETVFEGVAAGIRGRLVHDFVEVLQSHRDLVLARLEEAIGEEVAAVQRVIQSSVSTLEQANHAVASTMRVLDEVAPELAWELIRSEMPEARGPAEAG